MYVEDSGPGLTRRKRRGSFVIVTADGKPVRDARVLRRVAQLAIPPAWTDLWICPHATGHIQATGRDRRGRKQYLYHPEWRAYRDEAKFERMLAFGAALGRTRRALARALGLPGLPRAKVLAAIVRLLETTHIRIGNDEYARDNDSYGLTTLQMRHVRVRRGVVSFHFRGKSGVRHAIALHDARLARVVRRCRELPGREVFRYLDADGRARSVTSSDVNAFLREVSGLEVTAKDFRTWAGTTLAALELLGRAPATSATAARRVVGTAIDAVARQLGNTKTICRKSYVHPAIIEAYLDGSLASALGVPASAPRARIEEAVLRFLGQRRHARAPSRRAA
jgi:DNA topoisomerase-1